MLIAAEHVSYHPRTNLAHTRVVERRDATCRDRRHEVGSRLRLRELLPGPQLDAKVVWPDVEEAVFCADR